MAHVSGQGNRTEVPTARTGPALEHALRNEGLLDSQTLLDALSHEAPRRLNSDETHLVSRLLCSTPAHLTFVATPTGVLIDVGAARVDKPESELTGEALCRVAHELFEASQRHHTILHKVVSYGRQAGPVPPPSATNRLREAVNGILAAVEEGNFGLAASALAKVGVAVSDNKVIYTPRGIAEAKGIACMLAADLPRTLGWFGQALGREDVATRCVLAVHRAASRSMYRKLEGLLPGAAQSERVEAARTLMSAMGRCTVEDHELSAEEISRHFNLHPDSSGLLAFVTTGELGGAMDDGKMRYGGMQCLIRTPLGVPAFMIATSAAFSVAAKTFTHEIDHVTTKLLREARHGMVPGATSREARFLDELAAQLSDPDKPFRVIRDLMISVYDERIRNGLSMLGAVAVSHSPIPFKERAKDLLDVVQAELKKGPEALIRVRTALKRSVTFDEAERGMLK